MFHGALFFNLAFVAVITWASYRHFSREASEPRGAVLLSLATAAGTLLDVWLALGEPRAGLVASAASLVVTATAFAIFFAALGASRDGGLSLAFSDRTPDAVVDRGIYGVIRHPFYASYCLYWMSWAILANGHPLSIAICVAMVLAYVAAVRSEERLLAERLGQPYRLLMQRSWRLAPWIY
jgi:protein-S-isoprenylcysteine O-methyltransferase Ste14